MCYHSEWYRGSAPQFRLLPAHGIQHIKHPKDCVPIQCQPGLFIKPRTAGRKCFVASVGSCGTTTHHNAVEKGYGHQSCSGGEQARPHHTVRYPYVHSTRPRGHKATPHSLSNRHYHFTVVLQCIYRANKIGWPSNEAQMANWPPRRGRACLYTPKQRTQPPATHPLP